MVSHLASTILEGVVGRHLLFTSAVPARWLTSAVQCLTVWCWELEQAAEAHRALTLCTQSCIQSGLIPVGFLYVADLSL